MKTSDEINNTELGHDLSTSGHNWQFKENGEKYWSNPLVCIEERALELAGLTRDEAFEIDTVNLINDGLMEEEAFFDLAEAFFTDRVFDLERGDVDENIRNMYDSLDPDELVANYSDFWVQRSGGMDFFTSRLGMPSLLRRHQKLDIQVHHAEEWLRLMQGAMDDLEAEKPPKLSTKPRRILTHFFSYLAYYLVAGAEATKRAVGCGAQDKHSIEEVGYGQRIPLGCPHAGRLKEEEIGHRIPETPEPEIIDEEVAKEKTLFDDSDDEDKGRNGGNLFEDSDDENENGTVSKTRETGTDGSTMYETTADGSTLGFGLEEGSEITIID
jgi:truncated hemoglobin YjbI